jgi:L-aminopeptidase/D-esterase-like protein
VTVGALVAVNAVGDVIDPTTGRIVAGLRSADGRRIAGTMPSLLAGEMPAGLSAGMATTIGCIATDALLTKAQAQKMAQMAQTAWRAASTRSTRCSTATRFSRWPPAAAA